VRGSAPPELINAQISPEEGRILQVLLRMIQAKRVLEIGTLVGYSTLWLASALPDDGKVTSIEKSENFHILARANISQSSLNKKIELLCGDALDVIPTLGAQSLFDAIFIDAKKADYPAYLEKIYDYLKPNGVILADNTLRFGEHDLTTSDNPATASMHKFNMMLADENRFITTILPTNSGLTIAVKV